MLREAMASVSVASKSRQRKKITHQNELKSFICGIITHLSTGYGNGHSDGNGAGECHSK